MSTSHFKRLATNVKQEEANELLKVNLSKRKVSGKFWVSHFVENDSHVAYMPSLRASGYGDSEAEAEEMLFEGVLSDIFEHLMGMTPIQISIELAKYGWKHDRLFSKRFSNVPYVDKDGILRDFNLPEGTEIRQGFVEKEVIAA